MGIHYREIPLVGGFYERLIGIIKSSLRKTLGKAKISYVEMCTIISEVEGNMNNRSLTHLNEETVKELIKTKPLVDIGTHFNFSE